MRQPGGGWGREIVETVVGHGVSAGSVFPDVMKTGAVVGQTKNVAIEDHFLRKGKETAVRRTLRTSRWFPVCG